MDSGEEEEEEELVALLQPATGFWCPAQAQLHWPRRNLLAGKAKPQIYVIFSHVFLLWGYWEDNNGHHKD